MAVITKITKRARMIHRMIWPASKAFSFCCQ